MSIERLKVVGERLKASGRRVGGITWGPDAAGLSREQRADQLADFLERYLDGQYEVVATYDGRPWWRKLLSWLRP
jgi:hypothetical protein